MSKLKRPKTKKLFLENRKQDEINFCNHALSQIGQETFYVTIKGLGLDKNHQRSKNKKIVVSVIGKTTGTVMAQRKDFDVYKAFDSAITDFMEKVRRIQLGEPFKRVAVKYGEKIAA